MNRHNLLGGIKRYYGGLNKVRTKMGFDYKNKPNGYWKKWENIKRELKLIIKKIGHFPTDSELQELRRYDLLGWIEIYHSNLISVRKKMGYKLDDLCERASYHAKRGYNTQKYVLDILKKYADVRGITYSQKKETMVGPGHFLELICDKNNLIGVDITNAKHERTVTRKWEEKKYHLFVNTFWIIVISDEWDYEQYEKWNEDSPENVIVIDGRKLEEFLNSIGSDDKPFEIPKSKKQKLDALARCTFWNKEKIKKEYEFLTKQKRLSNLL
ncbi:MAG: hypothetical protein ACFFDN_20150 [Candidatus Hodarchaeota archaeon]